jgi:formamidopyrimidine-DNA glycosylase
MPELPEVETVCRYLATAVAGRRIAAVLVREARLRQPIPPELPLAVAGATVETVWRRGKYLLWPLRPASAGILLLHLGMSGSLRHLPVGTPAGRHDHVDLVLDDGTLVRLRDPRRFGLLLLTAEPWEGHPLLRDLGPEPLEEGFTGEYLLRISRGRRQAIKSLLMDARRVVGVGNIYANEALFVARIHPEQPAGEIPARRCGALVAAVRQVLADSIARGGTTLQDFQDPTGQAGYYALDLAVYGRAGEPCRRCGTAIQVARLGGRATYHCPRCQRHSSSPSIR